jgi:hypothetical protein
VTCKCPEPNEEPPYSAWCTKCGDRIPAPGIEKIERLLHHIKEQSGKRQYLNALGWTNELEKILLRQLSQVLKS